jgi:hypothetical protein
MHICTYLYTYTYKRIYVYIKVIVVEDCIVMILKPQEFYRKKTLFTEGGGGNMQVFSDFEHVLTQTQENGARTVSSGELLECAQNVLSPNAVRTYSYIHIYIHIYI